MKIGYIDTWLHRHLVTPTLGYTDTWLHQHLVTPTLGYTNTWLHRHLVYTDTWLHRHLVTPTLVTPTLDYTDTWLHCHIVSLMLCNKTLFVNSWLKYNWLHRHKVLPTFFYKTRCYNDYYLRWMNLSNDKRVQKYFTAHVLLQDILQTHVNTCNNLQFLNIYPYWVFLRTFLAFEIWQRILENNFFCSEQKLAFFRSNEKVHLVVETKPLAEVNRILGAPFTFRVARVFLVQRTKNGKIYTKWP
jgi:hypothetical protein